jgi:hypothetical protein
MLSHSRRDAHGSASSAISEAQTAGDQPGLAVGEVAQPKHRFSKKSEKARARRVP